MIHLRKIMVPTDFSESAKNALRYGCSFAQEYKAALLVLHVVETAAVGYASDLFPVPMTDVFRELETFAKTELRAIAAEIRSRGLAVEDLIAQGKPSTEIIRLASEKEVDMIVLGAHGKGVLDQAIFGSTTERVVRRAPCPVLTCRVKEHEFVEP
jgi:nucleotide-binding universal stress UspA family protein